MSAHLSPEQISAWVIGERSGEVERHLDECAACRVEVGGFEETLLSFRNSAQQWSEEHLDANFRFRATRRGPRSWITGFSIALATLVLCFVIGRLIPWGAPENPVAAVATATSDADLLKRIDQEVSCTVPGPMQPLTRLVSWDASASSAQRRAQ